MAFRTGLTGTAALPASLITAYDKSFIVANAQNNVMDQFVQLRQEIGAKTVQFQRFSRLPISTTPLSETDEQGAVTLASTAVTFTPLEYGSATTLTSLEVLQSGGVAALAATELIGMNLAQTQNLLATQALGTTSNGFYANGKTDATLAAGDIISGAFLNTAYNKLARASIPKIDGSYVMFAHDDIINDLRADVGVGSWVDVSKYATPETVLVNEVGMFKGFRVVVNNDAAPVNQAGGGFIDDYPVYFMGYNALGKAISKEAEMLAMGPFDNMGRFVNLSWYGVFNYGIVEPQAIWVGHCASSVGANAS